MDRVTACLVGGALGDALGYPIEFVTSHAEIVRLHGAAPPARLLRCEDGAVHVSDDTQMTLFTAEGLVLAKKHDVPTLAAVHGAYQRWLYTQQPSRFEEPRAGWLVSVPAMIVRRAPGNTCLSALMDNVQQGRTPTIASPPNDSKGCGAIMRSAPFAFATTSRDEAFALARDAGVLTHGHPSGYLSAAYFASLVFDLARDVPFEEAMSAADALLAKERGHEETACAVEAARAMKTPPTADAIEALPNGGWVGEWALAIAIACAKDVARDEASVANAMWRAAAHGGDSDSTASLAGNLLGAMGAPFPSAWIEDLEMRDVIERTARELRDFDKVA
jgi:ADP-ribosylglycohydrolase